jgi:hypothetical protein
MDAHPTRRLREVSFAGATAFVAMFLPSTILPSLLLPAVLHLRGRLDPPLNLKSN